MTRARPSRWARRELACAAPSTCSSRISSSREKHERQLRDPGNDSGGNDGGARKALDKLLPFQRRDFIGIFKAMEVCR